MVTPHPALSRNLWQQARLSRRTLVAMAAMAPILTACGSSGGETSAAPMNVLRIHYPKTLAFSAPFLLVAQGNALQQHADAVEFSETTTPETLGSALIEGAADAVAVPSHVGATLAQEYMVSLAAVVVWGNLWLLGPDDAASDWASVRGQKISVPQPNDIPDLIFRHLAEARGLGRYDYQIEHLPRPEEVAARLERGETKWAVLPEPLATMALDQANRNGHRSKRVIDLQAQWAAVTGGQPRIPEAGIVVPTELARERPALMKALLEEMNRAVKSVNAAEAQTVTTIAAGTALPEPVVADVVPRLNLEVVPAAQARGELEAFFNTLIKLSPDIIGGPLPEASFYLDDPR